MSTIIIQGMNSTLLVTQGYASGTPAAVTGVFPIFGGRSVIRLVMGCLLVGLLDLLMR